MPLQKHNDTIRIDVFLQRHNHSIYGAQNETYIED